MEVSWNRGTPSYHPFVHGIFQYKPTIFGYPNLGHLHIAFGTCSPDLTLTREAPVLSPCSTSKRPRNHRTERASPSAWGTKPSVVHIPWESWDKIIWLVGQGHPVLKNMSSSLGMMKFPILMGKCKIDGNHSPPTSNDGFYPQVMGVKPWPILSSHGWPRLTLWLGDVA